ncbi:MAG: hypothetical protein ING19_19960 [Azospirillum sp.]|nr:hypothetical protein [Azospirillum sp.]
MTYHPKILHIDAIRYTNQNMHTVKFGFHKDAFFIQVGSRPFLEAIEAARRAGDGRKIVEFFDRSLTKSQSDRLAKFVAVSGTRVEFVDAQNSRGDVGIEDFERFYLDAESIGRKRLAEARREEAPQTAPRGLRL